MHKDREDPPPSNGGQGAIPKAIDLGSGDHTKSGSTVTGEVDREKGASGSEGHDRKHTGGARR